MEDHFSQNALPCQNGDNCPLYHRSFACNERNNKKCENWLMMAELSNLVCKELGGITYTANTEH